MSETTTDDDDPTATDEASLADRVRSHVRDNRTGMVHDLVFALAWVTLVSLLFDYVLVSAPTWAFYLFMLAGVPAYFGFFLSLEAALENR
ncbi:hypothetical protein GRS48_13050 [Halorubrum sp. JWXQ-INN 858]|uniref:hypothetical protein n=1 Tax=Halorubrum sp. JWXQ-INN 858 TaxID=2690782 RepID=UPI00135C720A|nr:hypothetical protein [Halorubrum sp. JWXQ-INN 858]MWV65740.1 hypothetical protein [Halorubrum sp. JWXQ-INN 858]